MYTPVSRSIDTLSDHVCMEPGLTIGDAGKACFPGVRPQRASLAQAVTKAPADLGVPASDSSNPVLSSPSLVMLLALLMIPTLALGLLNRVPWPTLRR